VELSSSLYLLFFN